MPPRSTTGTVKRWPAAPANAIPSEGTATRRPRRPPASARKRSVEEADRQLPRRGGRVGVVEHRRQMVVEGMTGALLHVDLHVLPIAHRRFDLVDLIVRDEGVLAAEVEQDRTGDLLRLVEYVGDPRPVIRHGCVGMGSSGDVKADPSPHTEPQDADLVAGDLGEAA